MALRSRSSRCRRPRSSRDRLERAARGQEPPSPRPTDEPEPGRGGADTSSAVARSLVEAFLKDSRPSVQALATALAGRAAAPELPHRFHVFHDGRRREVHARGSTFVLRTSVEFASPQVTLEELQGIVVARLLETCAPEFIDRPDRPVNEPLIAEVARRLAAPPDGPVLPFLMNVDDIEPDRYSINPLRASIVATGQSAFAVRNVRLEGLEVDRAFVAKYRGSLIETRDLKVIEEELSHGDRYTDFVERVKYRQLAEISERLGVDLGIPSYRMPLETLAEETTEGPLHRLVRACHRDLATLHRVYALFGREMGRRKTLLPAVPHAPEGFASKKAVSGKLQVDETRLLGVDVRYQATELYPNEIDKSDTAKAVGEARFSLPAEPLESFDFARTPASPQFAIYMVASPEDGALWHGLGRYAGSQIVRSYSSFHRAFGTGELFPEIEIPRRPEPVQWDLVAEKMLVHPRHHNIDASVGCVDDLAPRLVEAVHVRLVPRSMIDPEPAAAAE